MAATPLVSVAVPSVVTPFAKVTVPLMDAGSVSVKVTDAPGTEGFTEDVNVDTGDAFDTLCVAVPVADA
jgi:hypothetical protein